VSGATEFIAHPDVVMLDLPASSGDGAVRALHAAMAKSEGVTDGARFLSDVLERMQLAPVTIADDIALPHARTDAVSRLVMAVGRVGGGGCAFDPDHPRVRLVFLIGTPRSAVTEYLRVVAALTRILRNPAARSGLMTATTEDDFRSMLASRAAANR
jgi:mannitol/fructose-specific phosphotransferase system IIA component (Ntr-type)